MSDDSARHSCDKRKAGGQDGTLVYACFKLAGHQGRHVYARRELVEQLHEALAPSPLGARESEE
jgi:hypothetical protein